jgi:uncharacterized protein YbaP (TraB family)
MYYEIPDHNIRILGALHVFPAGNHLLPGWVQHAYAWAEILTKEHDSAKLDAYRRESDGVTPKRWQKYFEDVGSALGPQQQKSRSSAPAELTKFHDAWARADLTALQKVLRESPIHKIKALREAIFMKRNRQWAKEICTVGRSPQRHLYIVGCLHLVGKDNLLEMIKARGRKMGRLDQSLTVRG